MSDEQKSLCENCIHGQVVKQLIKMPKINKESDDGEYWKQISSTNDESSELKEDELKEDISSLCFYPAKHMHGQHSEFSDIAEYCIVQECSRFSPREDDDLILP